MSSGIYKRTEYHRTKISEGIKNHLPETVFKKGNKIGIDTRFKKGQVNYWKGKKPPNWESLYTPKINEKRRIARLKQKLPTKDTSIELKVKEWLEKRKIKYIPQFNLGNRFQCDFYLPLSNLIVECDGTYWHSLEKVKKRDKAKDVYAKQYGFNMLRLTEEQINKGQIFIQ